MTTTQVKERPIPFSGEMVRAILEADEVPLAVCRAFLLATTKEGV